MKRNKVIASSESRINGMLEEANKDGWVAKDVSIASNGVRQIIVVLLEKED